MKLSTALERPAHLALLVGTLTSWMTLPFLSLMAFVLYMLSLLTCTARPTFQGCAQTHEVSNGTEKAKSASAQTTVLTVEASLLSLAPFVGRPASLEFLGCLRSGGALPLFALPIVQADWQQPAQVRSLGVR